MRSKLLLLAATALLACGGSDDARQRAEAAGDIASTDSTNMGEVNRGIGGDTLRQGINPTDTLRLSSTTPSAGVLPVTANDAKRAAEASDFKLTEGNFTTFAQATRRLSFLRARDPQIRQMLDQARTDAAMADRMEKDPQIQAAMQEAGMTVRDYQVMGIAIASAQQYMSAPEAAPPTPTLRDNAAFLQKHRDVLNMIVGWWK